MIIKAKTVTEQEKEGADMDLNKEQRLEKYRKEYQIMDLNKEQRLEKYRKEYRRERIKEINEIANYFFEHDGIIEDITKYEEVISNYEYQLKELDKEIRRVKRKLNNIDGWRLIERLNCEDNLDEAESGKQKFVRKNQKSYLEAINFFDSLPDGYVDCYDKYKSEILQEVERLKKEKKEKEYKENQEKQKKRQEAYQKEIQSVEEERKRNKDKAEEQIKVETVNRAISDFDDFLTVLGLQLQKDKKIDLKFLKSGMKTLGKIENFRAYIPAENINDIERSQREFEGIIDSCENKNELEIYIREFKLSFEKILNRE